MLAAHCPRCGAPNPVSLATPERQRCDHCKYDGAPAPETLAHLRHARDLLLQQDAGERTLNKLQRRTLLSAWWQKLKFASVLLLVTIPFVLFAGTCSLMSGHVAWWVVVIMGFLPVTIMFASGAFGAWIIARARRNLEEACAATPPRAPGEPACCHVCGAPLSPAPGEVVCSCGFCRADNVVAPAVLERMRSRSRHVFHHYESEIRHEARSLGAHSTRAIRVTLAAAVTAPLLSLGALVVVAIALTIKEDPVNAEVEYVAWKTPEALCLGRLWRRPTGDFAIEFSSPPPGLTGNRVDVKSLGSAQVFRASELVHKLVFTGGGVGKVVRVYGDALLEGENRAVVALPDGGEDARIVQSSCLTDAATTTRLYYATRPGKTLARTSAGLFFAEGSDLVQVSLSGGAQKTKLAAQALAVAAGGDVIWAATDRQVYRGTSVSQLSTVAKHAGQPKAMAATADSAWVASTATLRRYDATGMRSELRSTTVHALAADDAGTYAVTDLGVFVVEDAALRRLVDRIQLSKTIALDGTHLYVSSGRQVYRVDRVSGQSEVLYTDSSNVERIAVLDGALIWGRARAGKYAPGLMRYDVGEKQLTNVDAAADGPLAVAVGSSNVFWLARDGSVLRRALD
jgi:hypothetical protein